MKKKISILLTLVMMVNIMLTFSVSAENLGPGTTETVPYYWVTAGVPDGFLKDAGFQGTVAGKAVADGYISLSVFMHNTTLATGGKIIIDYDETKVKPMTWKTGFPAKWADAATAALSEANNLQFMYSGDNSNLGITYSKDKNYLAIPDGNLALSWFLDVGINSATDGIAQIGAVMFQFIAPYTATDVDGTTFKILNDPVKATNYTTESDCVRIKEKGALTYSDISTPAIGKTYVSYGSNTTTFPSEATPTPTPTATATAAPATYNIPVNQIVVDKDGAPIADGTTTIRTISGVLEGVTETASGNDLLKASAGGIDYSRSENLGNISAVAGVDNSINIYFRQYTNVTTKYMCGSEEIKNVPPESKEIGTTVTATDKANIVYNGYTYTYDATSTDNVVAAVGATITLKFTKVPKAYDVTIKYVDGDGNALKANRDVKGAVETTDVAITAADKDDIIKDGKTYGFASASAESITPAPGATITLTFTALKAPLTINYVNAVGGAILDTVTRDEFVGSYTASTSDKGMITVEGKNYEFDAVATPNLTVNVAKETGATLTLVYKETVALSNNSNLVGFFADGLNVTFVPGKTTYDVTANAGYKNYVLKGYAADTAATVTYSVDSGAFVATSPLSFSLVKDVAKTVVIRVTAADSTYTDYTFNIILPKSSNVDAASAFVSGFQDITITNATTYDLVAVKSAWNFIFSKYVFQLRAKDSKATVSYMVDSVPVSGSFVELSLKPGDTKTIVATITAENGTSKDYTFNVTFPQSGNAKLDRLFTDGFDASSFDKEGKNFTFNAYRGYAKYVLKAFAQESGATVAYAEIAKVDDAATASYTAVDFSQFALVPGTPKIIAAKVTAEAGTTEYYTFTITLAAAANNNMEGSFVSGFKGLAPEDMININSTGSFDLKYNEGFAFYVFQFRSNRYAKVAYVVGTTGTTPTFGANSDYISIPRAEMGAGKSIFVKVTAESGDPRFYEFKLIK